MMWTNDPVRDEMRYQYEQEESRNCLHCILDNDSQMCEDCIELGIEEDGCDY